MITEVTQKQISNSFTPKLKDFDKIAFNFEEKLNQKISETKNIHTESALNNINSIKSNQNTCVAIKIEKPPTKSRVEQTIDNLKEMVKNAIDKKSSYSKEEINNMNLSQLTNLAKSVMKDASSFINMAKMIPILEKLPEDCGCVISFDASGKCTYFAIYKPDGTILMGDINQVQDIFTEDDFDLFIESLKEEELKGFLSQNNNPLEIFDSLTNYFKDNNKFNKQLNNKIDAAHEQILSVNKYLNKEAKAA